MKKNVVMLAVVLLLFTGAAWAAPSFRDMTGHWAEAVVNSLAEQGIIGGYEDGTYRPQNPVSRGEFVKLLAAAAELEIKDWSGDHWATPYLTAAIGAGIVVPLEYEGEIDLRGPIPREEMAAMLVRAQGLQGKDAPLAFTDGEDVRELYRALVAEAVNKNLLGGYPDGSFRPQGTLTRAEAAAVISRILEQRAIAPFSVGVNRREIYLQTKRVALTAVMLEKDSVYPRIVFANNQTQGLETIEGLAVRNGAVAAITGSFFDHAGSREPWGNIIAGGAVAHVGDVGSTLGFLPDGSLLLERMRVRIDGRSGLRPGVWDGAAWRAWGFNRTPGASGGVFIYTPQRGERLGFAAGTSVVVQNGQVTAILDNWDVMIPYDGYVINFSGYDKRHASAFSIGQFVTYDVRYECSQGQELTQWYQVAEAVAAGPTLLKNGEILADSAAEKVNVAGAEARVRAAVALTADGHYLLVTTRSTIRELAVMLQKLGAVDALNLDGGGSAALWYQGETVTRPTRQLNNAIIFSIRSGAAGQEVQ